MSSKSKIKSGRQDLIIYYTEFIISREPSSLNQLNDWTKIIILSFIETTQKKKRFNDTMFLVYEKSYDD